MFTKQELLDAFGSPYTNQVVPRLRRFAYIAQGHYPALAQQALNENWGQNLYVLEKYLAIYLPWAVEQERFTQTENQFYISAGHLQSRYGTPLYLVFERNHVPGTQPFKLVALGSSISAPELPLPPDIPSPTQLDKGAEIVMMHDHILGQNADRVSFLSDTPPVAQMCAVAGAIQWSLNRKLQLPYWYYGTMNYVVPLYLQSRENITLAPDLIAPIQANGDRLMVRTVLLPHMPYPSARVAVTRHDQLPHWLLDAWNDVSENPPDDTSEA